ncbi:hypothetical protein JCM5353_003100 [Sporobolomyces roseus]
MPPLRSSTQPQESSLVNFAHLPQLQGSPQLVEGSPKPRAAPGARGPVPRACQWCRRLRAKCVFSNGGRIGEARCNACVKKDRPVPAPRVEQAIVSTQLSSAAGSYLFDLYFDASKPGVESNILPILFHDGRSLQARYALVGRKLELLNPSEQLRCRLVWAASSKRWQPNQLDDGKAISAQILQGAQEQADSAAIWRRPTIANFISLHLLFGLTANGNFKDADAQYYLLNACQHFGTLFPTPSSFTSQVNEKQGWAAYSVATVDAAIALENGTAPHLSDQAFATFPTDRTPYEGTSPAFLLRFSPHADPQRINQGVHPLSSYLKVARSLAQHFSRLELSVANQQNFQLLLETFRWMDSYERWAVESLALHNSQEVPHLVKTGAQSAITLLYIPCLMLEFSVREHLRRRVSAAENENVGGFPSESIASLISFLDATEERCQRSLCKFLRHTRNREGVYLLSAVTGYLSSNQRLCAIATTLCKSSQLDWELFPLGPVDKLASVTFLLKSIRSAQIVCDSPILAHSVALLEESQATLQEECGYSGDMALILIASYGATASDARGETHVPDVPSEDLVDAAILMAGGAT